MKFHLNLIIASLGLVLSTEASFAQTDPSPVPLPMDHAAVKAVVGGWDIEAHNGRKCRMRLNAKGARDHLVIGVPVPCKLSIPALSQAAIWALSEDGQILFKSGDGKIISQFAREGTGPMRGKLGADTVSLLSVTGRYPDAVKKAAIVAATSPQKPISRAQAAAKPIAAPPLEKLPGLYAMMRYAGREVCRITLEAKPAAKPEQNIARFSGSCGDAGLATFEPVAWRFKDSRLFLIARKGHETGFSFDADGMWRKDPATGATLILNKVN